MEEQKGLIKSGTKLPAFVEDAYESVEKMQAFADLLLKSKLCPDHLYEKGADGKPDYTQGKTPATVMILLQGHQLDLPPLMALQHIVPINGLLSIKGIAAKSLILNSSKIKKGSWKENITGTIEGEDYEVSITATRSDTEETMTRAFSVADSKRAGLWVTKQMVDSKEGWKYNRSPWWKYQKRMIFWRCLGDIAKDLFTDVLLGSYITEEARDLPQDAEVIIETPKGEKITIPDKEHVKERSVKLTNRAADMITKNATDIISKATSETTEPTPIDTIPEEEAHVYTEQELLNLGPKIYDLVEEKFSSIFERVNTIPGKKSNKRYRLAILSVQQGKFEEWYSQTMELEEGKGETSQDTKQEGETPPDPFKEKSAEELEFEKNMGEGTPEGKLPKGEAEPTAEESPADAVSFFGINLTSLPESGARAFPEKRAIFGGLRGIGVNEDTFKKYANELACEDTGETFLSTWPTVEEFSKGASVSQLKEFINVFKAVELK